MAFQTQDISFKCDGLRLNGVLHLPEETSPPVVVGSHGLASDGDSPKQIDLASACNRLGMAYFRFHHRGCGSSEGYFPEVTSIENRVRDLVVAVKTVLSLKYTGDRLALFGSSMGGTTCLATSCELNAEGYVVVAAPVTGKGLTRPPEEAPVDPSMDEAFYRRLIKFDVRPDISKLQNILIFHGDKDLIVPVENGYTTYELARDPKKIIIQKNGDHRISNPEHQKEFIREASLWLKKCFYL